MKIMYVCMHLENIYARAEPYSLDCHRGNKNMYHCAWEENNRF